MPAVILIEAPGKLAIFRRWLRLVCGQESAAPLPHLEGARVIATGGHFRSYARDFHDMGLGVVDGVIQTPGRHCRDIREREIAASLMGDDAVYIATDPDAEGEAIAADILSLIGRPSRAIRVYPRSLDNDGLTRAFREATPIHTLPAHEMDDRAAPALSRVALDRIIGWDGYHRRASVGRVMTPVLFSLINHPEPDAEYLLEMPAADGGRPFVGRSPSPHPSAGHFPIAPDGPPVRTLRPPPHTGDLLAEGGLLFGRPLANLSQALQSLYEEGVISYPRSDERRYQVDGEDALCRAMGRRSLRFDQAAWRQGAGGIVSHEAPRIVDPAVLDRALAGDDRPLGDQERMLALIAEGMTRAARPVLRETVVRDGIVWTRDVDPLGPLPPLVRRRPGPRPIAPDLQALRRMLRLGLGRPSTWADHATRLGALFAGDRAKVMTWLSRSPPQLLDPVFCRGLEDVMVHMDHEWHRTLIGHMHEIMPWMPLPGPECLATNDIDGPDAGRRSSAHQSLISLAPRY